MREAAWWPLGPSALRAQHPSRSTRDLQRQNRPSLWIRVIQSATGRAPTFSGKAAPLPGGRRSHPHLPVQPICPDNDEQRKVTQVPEHLTYAPHSVLTATCNRQNRTLASQTKKDSHLPTQRGHGPGHTHREKRSWLGPDPRCSEFWSPSLLLLPRCGSICAPPATGPGLQPDSQVGQRTPGRPGPAEQVILKGGDAGDPQKLPQICPLLPALSSSH